ncbi:MAG: sigma factor-like helix-turn-helix DNA-binding protein [bacterium]|nr:sigma factor-like helix-turn-helix DNA-binding protein [bacterium]
MNNLNNHIEDKNEGEKFSFFSALKRLFADVPERPRKIIGERYGLKTGKKKTLEEIGKEYGITRERVRQIIRETVKKIKKAKNESLSETGKRLEFTIQEKNGIMQEEKILSESLEPKERGAIKFFLHISDNIVFREISGELKKSWMIKSFDFSEWKKVKDGIKLILEKNQKSLAENEILKEVREFEKKDIERKKLLDYLDVSAEIQKSHFGKWGLAAWDEINPRGTREKIYLVLKEVKKPIHFREIAIFIDKYGLSGKKKAHPQTVHNELIRDNRFILVGRGTYALAEWGYRKGTVKEVLESIFKENSKLLSREEIISKVLSIRKVKKSTVLINLNSFFQKAGKNEYFIKK